MLTMSMYVAHRRRYFILLGLVLTALFSLAFTAPAGALDGNTVFIPAPVVILLISGAVIPLVTGLIVKASASGTVKSLTTVILTIISTALTWVIEHDGGFKLSDFFVWFVMTFVAAIASYYGVWKPVGDPSGAPTMNATPNFGIGPSSTTPSS